MTMPASYLTGPILVAGLTAGWIFVQSAWRKTFPTASADPDVLAGRPGCRGCARENHCERRAEEAGRCEEETR
jgi:hypothetical protein